MRAAGVLGGLAIVAGSAAGAIHPLAAIGVVLGVVAIVWVLSSPFNATLAFLIVLIARPADLLPGLEVLKPAKLLAISALGLWLLGKLLREDLTISRAPHGKWMVALGVAVGVPVAVPVGVAEGVLVGVPPGVPVGVPVGENVGVSVGEDVGVAVGVRVGAAVGVAVGVGVPPAHSGGTVKSSVTRDSTFRSATPMPLRRRSSPRSIRGG